MGIFTASFEVFSLWWNITTPEAWTHNPEWHITLYVKVGKNDK